MIDWKKIARWPAGVELPAFCGELARVVLLFHSEVLLVIFPTASENDAVACSREIFVFFSFNLIIAVCFRKEI